MWILCYILDLTDNKIAYKRLSELGNISSIVTLTTKMYDFYETWMIVHDT